MPQKEPEVRRREHLRRIVKEGGIEGAEAYLRELEGKVASGERTVAALREMKELLAQKLPHPDSRTPPTPIRYELTPAPADQWTFERVAISAGLWIAAIAIVWWMWT